MDAGDSVFIVRVQRVYGGLLWAAVRLGRAVKYHLIHPPHVKGGWGGGMSERGYLAYNSHCQRLPPSVRSDLRLQRRSFIVQQNQRPIAKHWKI